MVALDPATILTILTDGALAQARALVRLLALVQARVLVQALALARLLAPVQAQALVMDRSLAQAMVQAQAMAREVAPAMEQEVASAVVQVTAQEVAMVTVLHRPALRHMFTVLKLHLLLVLLGLLLPSCFSSFPLLLLCTLGGRGTLTHLFHDG